jgi:enoyl-CoA hydratase/carnithine racemase
VTAHEDHRLDTVDLTWHGESVGVLTLRRPDAGNAISTQLATDVLAAMELVAGRPEAKVLVVTGAGRMFCAGADLREAKGPGWIGLVRRAVTSFAEVEVPVIAAINGACMGGGTEIALACDLRVAAQGVRIGLPEIAFGALPAAGGPQRLARLVGPSRAKWLIMSAARLEAGEAAAIGLVDRAAGEGRALEEALAMADQLAVHAGYALRTAKAVIDRGADMVLPEALTMEYRSIDTMATAEERAAEVQRAMERSTTYGRIFGGPPDPAPPASDPRSDRT